jgi:Reverse transcriptase (RNA-dependent DNA polymerase)
VHKLKARFCAQGDKQLEGINYFETFSQVANWQAIFIMLILSIIHGLATVQVDYIAAFLHAEIDRDTNWSQMSAQEQLRSGVYVKMPQGFAKDGKVLKLKKSLYGLKQAPQNFFLHLKSKLEEAGFMQSQSDPCLFMYRR